MDEESENFGKNRNKEDSTLTEETVIFNEGVEDDYLTNKNFKLKLSPINKLEKNKNKQKVKIYKISNKNVNERPSSSSPIANLENQMHLNKQKKRKIVVQNEPYIDEDNNEEKITTNELFKKAIDNNMNKCFPTIELDNDGNTLSTKITEVLYDKYVGQNLHKSKHLDIYSKIKDEEIRQEREAAKTKQDAQKINNMIERQEDYEKLKLNKKKDRQREKKNKINEECVFIPNGKKNVLNIRTPNDFYIDQKKFIEKKEEIIQQLAQIILDKETQIANTVLISKNSEKLANIKNPNESRQDFCKRLAQEKLKNVKIIQEYEQKEEKKLTKKELKDLTDKLYKEGETFKNNRVKREQEQINKIKKLEKNKFVLEKSKKVLFDKFMTIYEKTLNNLFNKNGNFQINYDEYKNVMYSLGFIKSNLNSRNENLIKESFNSLKPQNNKKDTYSFLIFALTALGIYKGNDEKPEEHSSKVVILKNEEEKTDENQKLNYNININNNLNKKTHNKTSNEIIKSYLPDLDLEKYGYTGKDCKIIKTKYLPFVSGMSETWAKDLYKKKQERQEKLAEMNKKNNIKQIKKLKKEGNRIIDSSRKNILKKEYNDMNNDKEKQRESYRLKLKRERDSMSPNSKKRQSKKNEVNTDLKPSQSVQIITNDKRIDENDGNYFIEYSTFDNEGNKSLLKIEVNLDNNKKDLLIICIEDDDFIKIVDDFCIKNELNDEKRNILIKFIEDKSRNNGGRKENVI